jgi:type III pantothenate kinase
MRVALVDIGNTYVHVGLGSEKKIQRQVDIPKSFWVGLNEENNFKRLRSLLWKCLGDKPLDGAVICSVVPSLTPIVKDFLVGEFGVRPIEFTWRCVRWMVQGYKAPPSIGADRLASAIAGAELYGKPVLVIGFGTAVTFNLVDANGVFLGGVIAPGLDLGFRYLHEKTAKLPLLKPAIPKDVVGMNTRDAMLVGVVLGHAFMVKGLIKAIKNRMGWARMRVVATGGYASFIKTLVPEIDAVHPTLVLEGLRIFWIKLAAGLR